MTPPAPDPSAALEACYRAAEQRMQGLPVVHPRLHVQAVGFRRWEGYWLGVVVTPWCMNLTLTPGERERWQPLAAGVKRRLRFPAGDYEFIGAHDPAFGEYQICSLFSPMERFADQAAAALVARLALEALLDPANAEPAEPADTPPAAEPAAEVPDRSKRDFLRGRLGAARGAAPADDPA
jgi:[NiFe] hydrogenase assembly HybE family chaperone